MWVGGNKWNCGIGYRWHTRIIHDLWSNGSHHDKMGRIMVMVMAMV